MVTFDALPCPAWRRHPLPCLRPLIASSVSSLCLCLPALPALPAVLQPHPQTLTKEIEAYRVATAGTGGDLALPGCSMLSSCAAAQCKRAAGLCWHLLTLLTHTRVPPPADAPRFEVHRLLMADSGTLLLCSVDTTGHLAKAS